MDEKIEESVTNGLDMFFTKLTDAADIVSTKLVEVAPDAAYALLHLVRFKGIFDLSLGALLLLMGLILCTKALEFMKRDDEDPTFDILGALLAVVSFVVFLSGMVEILSFYNWVAALYPEGAIALKALEAVGITL